MPNVEIEPKRGTPWWVWLLLVLLGLLLLWWLIGAMSPDEDAGEIEGEYDAAVVAPEEAGVGTEAGLDTEPTVTDAGEPGEAAEPLAPTDETAGDVEGPITDVLSLVTAGTDSEYVGQTVRVLGAPVQTARSGNVFWVGTSYEQKMLVVIDQPELAPETIEQGDRVDLAGTLRPIESMEQAREEWNLDEDAITALTNRQLYFDAANVNTDDR